MMNSQSGNNGNDKSRIRILCRRAEKWDLVVESTYSNNRGLYCVKIGTPHGSVYCITKSYQYKNLASFPKNVVQRAYSRSSSLGIFFGDDLYMGDGYVFTSDTVHDYGIENRGGSDKDDRKIWVDIGLEDGVNFGDFVTGREFPE